ncbi:hypothetical protein ACWD6P_24840 [Streptomyces sp. NPDC002446]
MTPGRGCRAVRAAIFAAACVLLAALGHHLMSGTAVPWWAMAAAFAATAAAAWVLAARERGVLVVTSAAVAAQAALHYGFSLAQAPPGAAETAMPVPPDQAHHVIHTLAHASHGTGGMPPFGMPAAHLLAALLCGLWLAHGEQAAFRILRAVAGRLVAPLRLLARLAVPPHRPRIRVRRARQVRVPRRLLLVYALTLRGPPSGIAAV